MKDENRENKRAEAPEAPVAPETGTVPAPEEKAAEIVELSEDTAEFDLEAILEEYTGQQEGAADAPESSPDTPEPEKSQEESPSKEVGESVEPEPSEPEIAEEPS